MEKIVCGGNFTTNLIKDNINDLIDESVLIKGDVTTLQGDVVALEGDSTSLRTDVDALQTDSTSLRTDVDGLKENTTLYNGIKTLPQIEGTALNVKGFYADTTVGGGQFIYDATRSVADHNGGTVIAASAIAAWDGTQADIATLLNWTGTGVGCWVTETNSLLNFGGINSSVTDNYVVISSLINDNLYIPKGNYGVSGSLLMRSENYLKGDFWGYGGTILTPLTDDTLFKRDPSLTGITRTEISNIFVAGQNVTSNYIFDLNECYLFVFEKIWLKDIFKGINITSSDSLTFRDVLIMETARSTAVTVGDNARSLKFITCNFETDTTYQPVGGGIFEVNGSGVYVSSADLIGCQFERSGILVEKGKVNVVGGKIASSEVNLKSGSRDCSINTDFYDSRVRDFGFNNVIKNAYCNNMATPEHKWPNLVSSTYTGNKPLYGAAGDEIVYLVTAASKGNASVTGGTIEIKEGVTTLSTSPAFNLSAANETIGLNARNVYTHLSVVKNIASPSNPNPVGSFLLGVKGGISLLPNSTFTGADALTSWLSNDVSGSYSGSNVLLTPTNSTWGLYQSLAGRCQEGKKYIAVAVFSGAASLFYGTSWDGSPGVRVLSDSGSDLYGDGFKYAMVSFEYHANLSSILSLGAISSSSAVTIKSFALIEA